MKNILHYIAIFLLFSWSTACHKTFFEAEPQAQPEAIFEDFWTSFQQHYGPFAERSVDWQAQYELFRPQVDGQTTDAELHTVLTQMVAVLADGHVNITAPDRPVFNANRYFNERIDDSLFNLKVVQQHYLTDGFKSIKDDDYVYGLMPNGIVYVYFRFVGANWDVMNDILEKYPDAKGLIVDLRHNLGGDFTYAFSNMGRLTDQKRFVFSSKTKNGPEADDFTGWHDWSLEIHGSFWNKKIAVLTDRYTISAGERATMAFNTLPNATQVGDTTNGAHSTMIGRELANGWKYTIATQKVLMPDGKSYEGIGIAPDVLVRNNLADLKNGRDAVLEKAMDLLE